MNDKISELLIGIKNASLVGKTHAFVPASKLKKQVLLVLKKLNYVDDFEEVGEGVQKQFKIAIAYNRTGAPRMTEVKRVSKLSKRVYTGYRNIMPVKYGHGHMVLSTPEGLMTESEAREKKIGGEALFIIW